MQYRKRNRLKYYDYSQAGWYYVTICPKDHKSYFGNIENGKMILNKYGKIVDEKWNWLHQQYEYCHIDEYIIMPDHFHGILIIDPENTHARRIKSNNVGTTHELSLQKVIKIKSLSELIGAFKMKSSQGIHLAGNSTFKWQRSFYDRIIRDEKELFNIRKYIQQNPLKWDLEKGIDNLNL
jgi:REP element-mobilizing transposase RayT